MAVSHNILHNTPPRTDKAGEKRQSGLSFSPVAALRVALHVGLIAAVCATSGCARWRTSDPSPQPIGPLPIVVPYSETEPHPQLSRIKWFRWVGANTEGYHYALAPFWGLPGQIFLADPNGQIASYALDNGARLQRWQIAGMHNAQAKSLPAQWVWGPLFWKDTVYALDHEAVCWAFALPDAVGKSRVRWKVPLGQRWWSEPVFYGNSVAWMTADGTIQKRDRTTGVLHWSFSVNLPPLSLQRSGALSWDPNGLFLYAGTPQGRLLKIRAQDGHIVWERTVSRPQSGHEMARLVDIASPPLRDGNTVWVAAYQGTWSAFDAYSGDLRWSHPASTVYPFAYDKKSHRLVIADTDGFVVARHARTGRLLWSQSALQGRLVTGPVFSQGAHILWLGGKQGDIYGLDARDGTVRFRHRAGRQPWIAPLRCQASECMARDVSGRVVLWTTYGR